MTGKQIRGTLLNIAIVLPSAGMAMIFAPATGDHFNHIFGLGLVVVGIMAGYIREGVKEEQANGAKTELGKEAPGK